MSSKARRPRWWQVYLMLPLFVGLFVFEIKLGLTGAENSVAQFGILLVIFCGIHLWIRANHSALAELEDEPGWRQYRVYETFAEPGRDAEENTYGLAAGAQTPTLRVPRTGVSGLLSDTAEWPTSENQADVFAAKAALSERERQ
jgi:hypothetical protein